MVELQNDSSLRLIKTYGRLKGRSLSKNQKLGLKMHKEKYDFSIKTKKKVESKIVDNKNKASQSTTDKKEKKIIKTKKKNK